MANYNDFIQSARQLIQGTHEIDFRNATSRAYYAGFHACKSVFPSFAYDSEQEGGTHKQLIKLLVFHGDNRVKAAGKALQWCKIKRENADYDIDAKFSKIDAREAIKSIGRLIGWVESFESDKASSSK